MLLFPPFTPSSPIGRRRLRQAIGGAPRPSLAGESDRLFGILGEFFADHDLRFVFLFRDFDVVFLIYAVYVFLYCCLVRKVVIFNVFCARLMCSLR